jgi:hypothetical protein
VDSARRHPDARRLSDPGARRAAGRGPGSLDDESNLALCALILSLYQRQWEAANPAWSLRARPDVLATLYQIGVTRSRPHASPGSNALGRRVRQVLEEPWLAELLKGTRPPA